MNWKKTVMIILATVLLTVAWNTSRSLRKELQICLFVRENRQALEALALDCLNGDASVESYKNIKIRQYGSIVQFDHSGFGIVPASRYYGFYYAQDGAPHGYQNCGDPLEQASDREWRWTDGTDNGGRTVHITGNWYYYEAWF